MFIGLILQEGLILNRTHDLLEKGEMIIEV